MTSTASATASGRRRAARAAIPGRAPAAAVATMLAGLDRLLSVAVDKTARLLGPATLLDPWRGMHLDANDVRRALRGEHVAAPLADRDAVEALATPLLACPRIRGAARLASLDALDVAILAVTLAPEIDLRYERIYAYLQDDIQRRRPCADLIANLLGRSVEERLAVLERLDDDAPLLRLQVLCDLSTPEVAPLARALRLTAPWAETLAGRAPKLSTDGDDVDTPPAWREATPEIAARVAAIVAEARSGDRLVRLVLEGPDGAGKYELALAIARSAGLVLRIVDLRACATAAELLALVQREMLAARVRCALPYLHGAGRLAKEDPQLLRALQRALGDPSIAFVLSSSAPLPCMGADAVSADRLRLQLPTTAQRERCWSAALAAQGVAADAHAVATTAERFVLSRAQIRQAAADLQRALRLGAPRAATEADMAAAARALCGDELARLAQRVRPSVDFSLLVAAPEVLAQLREMCSRVALRERVRRWCGDSVHRRAYGVNALFAGPSGTGKTLAAEIVANALELDLFRIDLSAVVSKYIGETEKNLDRVFTAATNANAVLFFDEAEALFGKRSEVKDAHDRYANIEIAYLLQKIESFDGVAILATNLKQNLDDAFTRRLTFCINFAFPEEAERLRLWQTLWPATAERAADVDFGALAREYRLSGGNIRNVVTASVYLAAADGRIVTRDHVLQATRREYQKFGKTLPLPVSPPERKAA